MTVKRKMKLFFFFGKLQQLRNQLRKKHPASRKVAGTYKRSNVTIQNILME